MIDSNISKQTKDIAVEFGASLVGFGPVSRFDGLPDSLRPSHFMPKAKTVISIALTMARGSLHTIEEGSYWISYNFDSTYYLNYIEGPRLLRMIGRFLEKNGYYALPLSNIEPEAEKAPYAMWAAGCGLGEIGRNGLLLTPEFGPRQRLCCLLTDAELEPTPLFEEEICDNCGECLTGCRAGALNLETGIALEIEGRRFFQPAIDNERCELERMGRDPKHSPFITGREYHSELPPAFYKYLIKNTQAADFCGGRGCIISCLNHLEKTGRIKSNFKQPLIEKERWILKS